jgi:hypothetical protein
MERRWVEECVMGCRVKKVIKPTVSIEVRAGV